MFSKVKSHKLQYVLCIILKKKFLSSPPQNRLTHFLPSCFASLPSSLSSPLVPAAMSSGSALSHLINRNLCYNDLSMSLWLYAYAMSAGDPVALIADFRGILHTPLCDACECSIPPDSGKAGTLLAERAHARIHAHTPSCAQCSHSL